MHSASAIRDYSLRASRRKRGAHYAGAGFMVTILDLPRLQNSMTSLPLCAAGCLSVVFMLASAPIAGPSTADHYAAAGAAFSAVIVLVAVRQFDKSFAKFVSALIGTLVVGVCGPGLAVQYFQGYSTSFDFLDWKTWMLLGFVFGLAGWTVTESLHNTVAKLVPDALAALVRKVFGRMAQSDRREPPNAP